MDTFTSWWRRFCGSEDNGSVQEVHSLWFHPFMSWLDLLLSLLIYRLIPLKPFLTIVPEKGNSDTDEAVDQLRTQVVELGNKSMQSLKVFEKWRAAIGCPVAYGEFTIPSRDAVDVLGEFDIKVPVEHVTGKQGADIRACVYLPLRLSSSRKEISSKETNELGLVMIEDDLLSILKNLKPEIPVILHYHGGGMVVGRPDNAELYTQVASLLKAEQEGSLKDPDVVFISLGYSLVPERPFPSIAVDALTALSFFVQNKITANLHYSGISAGAYVAAVAARAAMKTHPGLVKSVLLVSPMLDPACDSKSFYSNQKCCHVPGLVKYGWRAYLEMDLEDLAVDEVSENRLHKDSNHTAWKKSKWRNTEFESLIQPLLHLPKHVPNPPKFVVGTNRADSLMDDGTAAVKILRSVGVPVEHIDANGLHTIGYDFDAAASKKLVSAWGSAVYS